MAAVPDSRLTLGPLYFNWSAPQRRDFYFRIADEAPVDTVCLGEVVCAKREPLYAGDLPAIAERLRAAGKDVVFSTLSLVMNRRETDALADLAASGDFMLEANDMAAVALLAGRPHMLGPGINVYNEGTLAFLARRGATRVCLPVELAKPAIAAIAAAGIAETEVLVFGRLPLAISARCYHARAHGLHKDGCQYVCGNDPDGMEVDTLDHAEFLAVNGTQTMSFTCANLVREIPAMQTMGVRRFRLSPQQADMVALAAVFRRVLDGETEPELAWEQIEDLVPHLSFSNGFYHGVEGARLTEAAE